MTRSVFSPTPALKYYDHQLSLKQAAAPTQNTEHCTGLFMQFTWSEAPGPPQLPSTKFIFMMLQLMVT